jgi:hypothetical protein
MRRFLEAHARLLALGVVAGAVPLLLFAGSRHVSAAAPKPARVPAQDAATLQAQIDRLKGMLPDQSHAMADVGYHFANLWFAGDRKNWPLAKFCFDETRSHLRWAVRIIPVRKSPTGADLDMKSLLDAVDSGLLAELGKAIDASDHARFAMAYRQALEGCYSCHKTAGKPYLRPQVPTAPAAPILNFDPEAKWPQ